MRLKEAARDKRVQPASGNQAGGGRQWRSHLA